MQRLKSWIPALIWMTVIFMMSAMPGEVSGEQSGLLVKIVLWCAVHLFGPETAASISPDIIHLLVRKGAHMTEYSVLFWCYLYALKKEEVKRPALTALMLSALYAATDEWHQSFTEGRGPSIVDVGIDTVGAVLGWLGSTLFSWIRKKEC